MLERTSQRQQLVANEDGRVVLVFIQSILAPVS
jgi:hypothetical protein